MDIKRITVSALAAVLAVSGIGSILIQSQPQPVDAVELSDDREPAVRRPDDDAAPLIAVDDDDAGPKGDGDRTAGDDGTSGGNNTGDGDATQDTRDADTTD